MAPDVPLLVVLGTESEAGSPVKINGVPVGRMELMSKLGFSQRLSVWYHHIRGWKHPLDDTIGRSIVRVDLRSFREGTLALFVGEGENTFSAQFAYPDDLKNQTVITCTDPEALSETVWPSNEEVR